MKTAVIKDGMIWNVVMADEGWTPPAGFTAMPLTDALAQGIPYRSRAAQFPHATPRQVRIWLANVHGITAAQVDAMIQQLVPDPAEQAAALITWEYALSVERDNPLTIAVGAALGLTPEQLDAAWPDLLAI